MTLASGYPAMGVLGSMAVFFLWVLFMWLLFTVYSKLFARRDLSGWAKAGWVALTLILPFIGAFTYLATQGHADQDGYTRGERAREGGAASNGAGTPTDRISHAKSLLDQGAITPDEYAKLKHKALAE